MLEIQIHEGNEFFDQRTNEFISVSPTTVKLEHSLISVSKWESLWKLPYLPVKGRAEGVKGPEQEISYIECMLIGRYAPLVPQVLWTSYKHIIWAYIADDQSATTINRRGPQVPNREIITSEIIYYWMTKYNVPFSCDKWHFNRLLKLLEVCGIKETPKKNNRVSRREAINEIYALNAKRRAAQQS